MDFGVYSAKVEVQFGLHRFPIHPGCNSWSVLRTRRPNWADFVLFFLGCESCLCKDVSLWFGVAVRNCKDYY